MIKRIFIKLILALIIVLIIGGATFIMNVNKYARGEIGLSEGFKEALIDGLNKGLVMSWNAVANAWSNVMQRNLGTLIVDILVAALIWGFVFSIVSIPFDIFYAETGVVKPFLLPAFVALGIVILGGWWMSLGSASEITIIQNVTESITQNMTNITS